jgi:hypothetical protein
MAPKVEKVWTDDVCIYIQTNKGEIFKESFADYPRLRHASARQRAEFEWNEAGIRWEAIDEDLSFAGFIKTSAITETEYLSSPTMLEVIRKGEQDLAEGNTFSQKEGESIADFLTRISCPE